MKNSLTNLHKLVLSGALAVVMTMTSQADAQNRRQSIPDRLRQTQQKPLQTANQQGGKQQAGQSNSNIPPGPTTHGNRPKPKPTGRFDMNLFEQHIRNELNGKTIGYAYAINQNGKIARKGAGGYAVLDRDLAEGGIKLDPVGLKQSPGRRVNIASVSKTITAATVLRILQDREDLNINSKIYPFLPNSWALGNGVDELTFRDLLSQTSGMNNIGGGSGLETLRQWILTGVTLPEDEHKYINAHLAVFRIIIPFLVATPAHQSELHILAKNDPEAFSKQISKEYKEHVRKLIFEPMGIHNADCKIQADPAPTRLYHYPDSGKHGTLVDDWTEGAGGGGWVLSAMDLAKFLAHLRFNNNILKPETRSMMDHLYLGWQHPSKDPSLNGKYGVYRGHGGKLQYGADPQNGINSAIMDFPNGVQVALIINSLGTYKNKKKLIADAYDNSWIE